jgi:transcription elongation factor Elf1
MESMSEIDNCPICGTTCELEYGVEETIGFKDGREIMYATCKTCKTRWRRKFDAHIAGKQVYEKWVWRIPEINIPFPGVGGGIKISPKAGKWVKIRERQLPVGSVRGTKTRETEVKSGKTYRETISIEPRKYSFYEFKLLRGSKVKGEIISDIPIDVFFVDEKNFDRFDRGVRFEAVDATEGIYDSKPEFKATKKGLWFVVLANKNKNPAKAKVNLFSNTAICS